MTHPPQPPDIRVLQGNCRDVLATFHDASIDAIVTDPPYELRLMGKSWDGTGIAHDVTLWGECLRVLKPGGHLLAFGSARTAHRLTCAIEDAGFEIRDTIMWVYGSGYPKSHSVSTAIDKAAGAQRPVVGRERMKRMASPKGQPNSGYTARQPQILHERTRPATAEAARWDGWGTALKPAHEPIVVARKPLSGTVHENVLRYGTGALNIDACRIQTADGGYDAPGDRGHGHCRARQLPFGMTPGQAHDRGRWPANLVLDERAAADLDAQTGTLTSGANPRRRGAPKFRNTYGAFPGQETCTPARGADAGGPSRFFYCAKASRAERGAGNDHPAVKPLALIRHLVRLVTPPGGVVLDPFAGSGTTLVAARDEGLDAIGIEQDPDYCRIIRDRLDGCHDRAS